ncbi:hypothetical protein ACFYXS_25025 [Streptomyces sp. NPDC002574]|uniref:hypothetical protein n=1 Tax=Streptomyces sp. NPDC002574 TaxID=3364652 RepID=UPI0036A675F8
MPENSRGDIMVNLMQPIPLGYGRAAKEAQSIAAPLLTAAALSLAGVVAGADGAAFRWPGITLLVLVTTSVALVASIQLSYHARQYLYSRQDIDDWYQPEYRTDTPAYDLLCDWQLKDYRKWARFNRRGLACFNAGTILLGAGVALALLPPEIGRQAEWRWAAAAIVIAATIADMAWTFYVYRRTRELEAQRRSSLTGIVNKM